MRNPLVTPLGVCALGLAASAVPAGARAAAIPGWRSYVEAPSSANVSPVRVLATSGDVSDPDALVTGSGTTTLTYKLGGPQPRIVLDYGREVGGRPAFDVTAVTGAPLLDAAYSETRANLSASGDSALTPDIVQSGDLARSDAYLVTRSGAIADGPVQGGERYQSLTLTTPGSVTLGGADIRFSGFLGDPSALRGWFRSSDGLLNRIWYAGVYTLNLIQFPSGSTGDLPIERDASNLLLDGAKRDRLLWSGDLLADGPSVFYALDPSYIRDSLELLGQHPGTIAALLAPAIGFPSAPGPLGGVCAPYTTVSACLSWSASYSIAFVPALYEYYLYTGDLAFVRREWQAVTRQLSWDAQQLSRDGLFATNFLDGFDWNVEDPAGELTYDNSLYAMALRDGAGLAGAVGDPALAASYGARADTVAAAVNAELWDARLGAYDASTSERGALVQDANVFAALSGVATGGRAADALRAISGGLATPYGTRDVALPAPAGYKPIVSPYIGGFQLDADFEASLTPLALGLLRTEWGWMVDHDPGGTDWEKIEPNGQPSAFDSTAHGWSTGATAALSRYVLGVAPTSPGYASFEVAPHPGDVRWAQGSVPTPSGAIRAGWSRGVGSRSFRLTVRAPAGARATLALPQLGRRRTVSCSGRIVPDGIRARDGYVLVPARGRRVTCHWGAIGR